MSVGCGWRGSSVEGKEVEIVKLNVDLVVIDIQFTYDRYFGTDFCLLCSFLKIFSTSIMANV